MTYRVCYADTDRMGRVYYANYLVWCERARTGLLRDAGHPYREVEERGVLLPVRRCAVRYPGFAEYEDEVEFVTWISRLKRATVTFETLVRRPPEEAPVALGTVELACVNAGGRPIPIPEDLRAALGPYLSEAPSST
jgi:acyl-CoA thioester hydrolase